jgi:hypothetical protein
MVRLDPSLLRPGSWVARAQTALDCLSALTTLDEVVAEFGSARNLAVEVLGRPEFGGHATKPAIKALAYLLQHPIGPAVAAETLAVLASVADAVDTATVIEVLCRARGKLATCKPRRLELRHEITQQLVHLRGRADHVNLLWEVACTEPWFDELDRHRDFYWTLGAHRSAYVEDELATLWLRGERDDFSADAFFGAPAAHFVAKFKELDWSQQVQIAEHPVLFDLGESLLPLCLLTLTRHVLSNRACPSELSERVRNPYDRATLELAVRAGLGVSSTLLVRRQMEQLDGEALCDLAERLPLATVRMLRHVGLLDTEMLMSGALSGLDLTDVDLLQEVLRPEREDDWSESGFDPWKALVSLLTRREPSEEFEVAAAEALRQLIWQGAAVPVQVAQSIRSAGFTRLSSLSEGGIDVSLLTAADALLVAQMGSRITSTCPGIPANQRPQAARADLAGYQGPIGDRFIYPEHLVRRHGLQLPGATSWTFGLFRRTRDLESNALQMRNCTAGYADAMHAGEVVIATVTHRDGTVLNAELSPRGCMWEVGQINSFGNEYDVDPDVRPGLLRLLNPAVTRTWVGEWDGVEAPHRRCTTRRDRRRKRATAARRRKR